MVKSESFALAESVGFAMAGSALLKKTCQTRAESARAEQNCTTDTIVTQNLPETV